jgi:hypothetical protein
MHELIAEAQPSEGTISARCLCGHIFDVRPDSEENWQAIAAEHEAHANV